MADPELVPVEGNPFATTEGGDVADKNLVPVSGNPFEAPPPKAFRDRVMRQDAFSQAIGDLAAYNESSVSVPTGSLPSRLRG